MSFLFCIEISLASLFSLYRWGNWGSEKWSDCTQTENRKFRIQIHVFWLLASSSFCYNFTSFSHHDCYVKELRNYLPEITCVQMKTGGLKVCKPVENLCLINHQRSVRTCMNMQLSPTLCHLMDCSPPGSFVHGILQARILEWVAISFSRGFSQPRDLTHISCISGIGRQVLYQVESLEKIGYKQVQRMQCTYFHRILKIRNVEISGHFSLFLDLD